MILRMRNLNGTISCLNEPYRRLLLNRENVSVPAKIFLFRGGKTMSEFRDDFRYMRRKIERSIAPVKTLEFDFNKKLKNDLGRLDFNNPVYYPQKINWIKRYLEDELYQKCSDKYTVREYVTKKGLGFLLNELYIVYDSAEEIDFDELPDSFVLRANHGCGWNILCPDKSKLDISKAKKKLSKWMKKNYYYVQGERWYKDIKPRIVCERFLRDNTTDDLKDYKIFCFHGIPDRKSVV